MLFEKKFLANNCKRDITKTVISIYKK